ncbi:DUF4902 domain-containing protein [Trinickia sp. EG282A]|uniref:DUF4902 domain-containing protein n=1 Tax=Trinickia sp. EG282A TaxID=3237013 RepID=UPI0034D271C2
MRQTSAWLDSPSRDGYVRLPEGAVESLQLRHVQSAIDDELLEELRADGIDAASAGYTEWHRPHFPGSAYVTVGWDWYLDRASCALLIAWGDVRSNIMCVDRNGADVGMTCTARLLLRRLARLNWPNCVARTARILAGEFDVVHRTLQ